VRWLASTGRRARTFPLTAGRKDVPNPVVTSPLRNRGRRRAPAIALAALAGALLCAWTGRARATEVGVQRQYGVGLMVGDPTGLSGKVWLSRTNAIDLGLGAYSFGPPGDCVHGGAPGQTICARGWNSNVYSVNADYLWQSRIIEGRLAQLDWHIGGGARAFFFSGPCTGDCWDLGVRGPVGVDLTFQQPTFLEVFFELAPAFYVVPVAFFSFEGALGVRGYF